MQIKGLPPILIGLDLSGFGTLSQAENLMQVYRQAHLSDLELRKSITGHDTVSEKINEARSSLLLQLGLGTDYTYSNGYRDVNGVSSNAASTSLQLTRSIFDISKWHALTLQEESAGIRDVTCQIDRQTPVLNTTTAYFNILSAIDILSYAQAQRDAIYRQLDQTAQCLNVGLVAITDVQNARPQYDTILASEVTARNNLNNAIRQLRQAAGSYYPELASLNVDGLKTNKPQAVNTLLRKARNHSLSLLQTCLSQDLVCEQTRPAQGGHLSALNLTVSTGVSDTSYSGSKVHGGAAGNQYDDSNMGQNEIGLNFSLLLYRNGMVNSQVKQVQCNFIGVNKQLKSTHRNVVQTVHSSFDNINASISSINVHKQAVVSAQSSLDVTEVGYSVDTRTIVDALDATATPYNTKQQLADMRYTYLISQLNVELAPSVLNEQDPIAPNNAPGKSVSTTPDTITPENAQQGAAADGCTSNSMTSAAQPTAARSTGSNGGDPSRS